MAIKISKERFLDFGVTGQFGKPWEYGQEIYGSIFYGEEEVEWDKNEYGIPQYGQKVYGTDDKRWGIWQKRIRHGKLQFVKMNFMYPSNPQTATQQSWRAVFTAGMSAWSSLTTEQKKDYNRKASKISLHGVNLFLREYLKSN